MAYGPLNGDVIKGIRDVNRYEDFLFWILFVEKLFGFKILIRYIYNVKKKVTFTIWVMHLQIVSQKHLGKQVLDLLA